MAKSKKVVNYTDAQTKELVNAYVNDVDKDAVMNEYSNKWNKTVSSIRMKLVREGVYIPKAKQVSTKRVKKDEIVDKIESFLSVPFVDDSMTKATARSLNSVLDVLEALTARIDVLENPPTDKE